MFSRKNGEPKCNYFLAVLVASVMALPGAAGAIGAVAPHATAPRMSPVASNPVALSTCKGTVSTTSSNWGGYAVQSCLTNPSNDVVTAVSGTWVEPTAKCPSGKTSYAAFWVGIDGYTSSSVEQLGTDSDCDSGAASYYAWYEMYPAAPVNFKMTVKPGNELTASVTYTSAKKFVLKIEDVTTGVTDSVTKSLSSAARSSAEWIVEAPSSGSGVLPLADFGTVTFSACSATLSGVTGAIQTSSSTWEAAQMNIVGSVTEETTSSLNSAGNGFTGTWDAS